MSGVRSQEGCVALSQERGWSAAWQAAQSGICCWSQQLMALDRLDLHRARGREERWWDSMRKNERGTDLLGHSALGVELGLKTSLIASTRIFHRIFWAVCWVIPMSFSRWDECCQVRTAGREALGVLLIPQIILIQGSTCPLWVKKTVPPPCGRHPGSSSAPAGRTSLCTHTLGFKTPVSWDARLACAPCSRTQSILQRERMADGGFTAALS